MPTLLELQRAMHRGLLDGEDAAAGVHVLDDGLQAGQRLNIYRNTILSKLAAALRLSYPAVHRLVGGEFFEGAARIFVEERLPQSAYLDDYGAEFPEFLARFTPAASLPYLPDVARLEWKVNRALHAPDARPLDVRRLETLSEAAGGSVRFIFHPSIGLLRTDSAADLLWRAVLEEDDAALAAIDPAAGPVWLLVQRLDSGIDVQRLNEPAWHFAAGLRAGQPLRELVDVAGSMNVDAWLAEHLATGRIVGFALETGPGTMHTPELSQ